MKKKLVILTSIIFSFSMHSQTIEERKDIVKTYNKEQNNILLQNLIIKNQKRNLRIEKYITNHKFAKKNYSKTIWLHAASVGELMSIVPVIKSSI